MGDAVLRFAGSPAFSSAEHVLLMWGDLPFVRPETLVAMVEAHHSRRNDFTFVSRLVSRPYTVVVRDPAGRVAEVVETREAGLERTGPGERDVGLFVFRKDPVFEALREDLPGKWGRRTGEHGFLYVIGHLARRGFKVEALPIAEDIETVSFNSRHDLVGYVEADRE